MGSKSASSATYTPGTCSLAPGAAQPIGDAGAIDPVTFCCLAQQPPPTVK
jgi:hypothetical protein